MKSSHYYSHTDLALEIEEDLDQTEGYTSETAEFHDGKIRENRIEIKTVQAARRFGKLPGIYITLEGIDLGKNDGGFHESMSKCIARNLKSLIGSSRKLLVVGLGNRNITPDALGPLVIDNLLITRPAFLSRIPGLSPDKFRISSAIAPGVMAQTGMETVEIIRGIIAQTMPEKIIVIDALAARSLERLNSTVQISSTGISPGSGVGNHRTELSEDTLGIPVIAIGVPTVISIPSVARDILEAVSNRLSEEAALELAHLMDPYHSCDQAGSSDQTRNSDQAGSSDQTGSSNQAGSSIPSDRYRRLASFIDRRLFEFTMTPKEADESVRRISFTISEGINMLLSE